LPTKEKNINCLSNKEERFKKGHGTLKHLYSFDIVFINETIRIRVLNEGKSMLKYFFLLKEMESLV